MLYNLNRPLGCGDQIYQHFSRIYGSPDYEISEISLMGSFVLVGDSKSPEILRSGSYHPIAVLMYQQTAVHIYHIVKAFFSVEPQCKRPVLHTVSEAVLHLVAIGEYQRALDYLLILKAIAAGPLKKAPYSVILFQKLFRAFFTTIKTASAYTAEAAIICHITRNRLFLIIHSPHPKLILQAPHRHRKDRRCHHSHRRNHRCSCILYTQ